MARVGDVEITEGDLAALYEARSMPVGEEMRTALFRLAAQEALLVAMDADFGAQPDEDEVEQTYQALVSDLEARGMTAAQALGVPNAGLGMLRFNAKLVVIRADVTDHLLRSPEYLDALFANGLGVTTVCVKHVLLETEEEAEAVIERLEDGEDIGDVAEEVSLDTAERGDLGCRSASEFVTDFAIASMDAELGEPHGPVQSPFGWHVLVVSERTVLDRAVVEANPGQFVSTVDASDAWTTWFNDVLREAQVEVEPRFGTWTPTGISAPSDE